MPNSEPRSLKREVSRADKPVGERLLSAKQWYERHAADISLDYERFTFSEIHEVLLKHLPKPPALVLDIGSGTGRDAAGFSLLGHDVTAVEPSRKMKEEAYRLHPNLNALWIDDSLPKLKKLMSSGLSYDVIHLSAVWMHVARSNRRSAFRRLVTLLKPGGLMYFTLRHGPFEKVTGFWDIPSGEVVGLARDHGLFEVERKVIEDRLGRKGVTWSHLIFRSPDDATGALPLLRGIVLNDRKSSTYKLGLLRVLVQIAQFAPGMSKIVSEDRVELPLGLLALYWIRLYRPLLNENLPQSPINLSGTEKLSFAKFEFEQLKSVSPLDLRTGMSFDEKTSKYLHVALRTVCDAMIKMPMRYTTFPGDGEPIFSPDRQSRMSAPDWVTLDEAYLRSFGTVSLPLVIWQAVSRYGTWIEPAIVAEWKGLMKRYAEQQGRMELINAEVVDSAMQVKDPNRYVRIPSDRAKALIETNKFAHCVWSGKKLSTSRMDIDHCFPYSAWPCDDLWNLMPALRTLNQKDKRDKLPSRDRLLKSKELIQRWWHKAYVAAGIGEIEKRFFDEASASLSFGAAKESSLEDIFDSVMLQQINLKSNQQVPIWE